MNKILMIVITSIILFANDQVSFNEMCFSIEKLIMKHNSLELENTKLNNKVKNLNDQLEKLTTEFKELKEVSLKVEDNNLTKQKELEQQKNEVIVHVNKAWIRSSPIKMCDNSNIVKLVDYGQKLIYKNKSNDGMWYQLNDDNYISKLVVLNINASDENKEVNMNKLKQMECK